MGLQILNPLAEESKEAGGVWVVIDGAYEILENFEGLKYIFMAETADAEALEPQMLAEAKHCPNWLWWEKAVEEELATLNHRHLGATVHHQEQISSAPSGCLRLRKMLQASSPASKHA